MVLWAIWRTRNDVVWRDARLSVRVLIHHALGFLYDWLQVCSKVGEDLSLASRVYCKWHVPQFPFVTCIVDASFSNELDIIGLGMVVHDSHSHFLFVQSSWMDGCLPVREGEAVGVRETLS